MAGRQETGNLSMPDNSRVINNITERNEQQYLLLSTMYPFNSLYMKKLHVRLQPTREGIFEPIVKLTDNYAEGISSDLNAWKQFQENMERTTNINRSKSYLICEHILSVSPPPVMRKLYL